MSKSQFFKTEIAEFQGLHFITVKSNALKKRADITVYNGCKNYKNLKSVPLVILLHGVYGSHWAWALKGRVHETLQKLINEKQVSPMILAMPSDGLFSDGSGYVPHQLEDYEKWIVEDVIDVMKEQFTQIDEQSPIFITGLSMGGFGALRIGAKYPKLFKGFSGLSSITNFQQLELFLEDFEQLKMAAITQESVLEWMIANREILPPFRFDCGRDDLLIDYNRELHSALKKNKINHQYQEFSGGHTWSYWEKHIAKTLIYFNELANES